MRDMGPHDERLLDHIIRVAMRHHPRARRKTVDEFLAESVGRNYRDRMEDLIVDSHVYRWNVDTIKAIRAGLHVMLQNGLVER
jgi:uncharacterized protein (UPF0216 family)